MPPHIPLLPDGIYHIYNHANGDELLFRNKENCRFFLEKIRQHLLPVMDLFTYALLPNHFHLAVRVKGEEHLKQLFQTVKRKPFSDQTHDLSEFVMERMANCLNAYTKAYNKMYGRMGGLFMPTKRTIATVDESLTNFIFYIHRNAVRHRWAKKVGEWQHDGYNVLISDEPTFLLRKEVFDWFGSKEAFIEAHVPARPSRFS